MIAFPRFTPPDGLAAEVRRRVGGRALAMSEYAGRLVEAIMELWGLINKHNITASESMSSGDIRLAIELDGRIEALRIRLGIPLIPAKERVLQKGTELIGFTRFGIHRSGSYLDPNNPVHVNSDCDGDWYYRMRSLKAIAQELAIVPELDGEEEEIVALVMSVGRRLTTTQLLDEFSKRG